MSSPSATPAEIDARVQARVDQAELIVTEKLIVSIDVKIADLLKTRDGFVEYVGVLKERIKERS